MMKRNSGNKDEKLNKDMKERREEKGGGIYRKRKWRREEYKNSNMRKSKRKTGK